MQPARPISPASIYIHIPFCHRRCPYCDFNTYAGRTALIPAYVEALCREIASVGKKQPAPAAIQTVYFGGGTPSLLPPSQTQRILDTLCQHYTLAEDAEITLEANPGSVNRTSLSALRNAGINRLSLGMQSAHADELKWLGRIHTWQETRESVRWARETGFSNLNLDLLYGLPGQSLDRWQATLRQAIALAPEHLSLYALTIEAHTPLGRDLARGQITTPDADLVATMYEWASEYLTTHGYTQYEISNWARPGFACRHNLTYWRNQPYLGVGAGAHGYAGGYRYANVRRLPAYLRRMASADRDSLPFPFTAATAQHQTITRHTEMEETMILGLRLTGEGVAVDTFQQRFGLTMTDVFGPEIEELLHLGLVEWAQDENTHHSRALRLTKRGRLLGNQAFLRFVRA